MLYLQGDFFKVPHFSLIVVSNYFVSCHGHVVVIIATVVSLFGANK